MPDQLTQTLMTRTPEVTKLSPIDEVMFNMWLAKSGVKDLDTGNYDYRGFWKKHGPVDYKWGVDHLPDTFKQHGHKTFSQESQYSKGPWDGGMWLDNDVYLPQPKLGRSGDDNGR